MSSNGYALSSLYNGFSPISRSAYQALQRIRPDTQWMLSTRRLVFPAAGGVGVGAAPGWGGARARLFSESGGGAGGAFLIEKSSPPVAGSNFATRQIAS